MEKKDKSQKGRMQGPQISGPDMAQAAKEKEDYNAKAVLEAYWSFVRENPRDFNGWTYLLQHVENIDVVEEIRTAYNAFLPLYPYCYAYWIRYSDVERRHNNWSRALAILHRGLEAIPLSSELWIYYLELYYKMYRGTDDFDTLFNSQCERAIQTVGLDYR
jgi:pre-mRNA-processing factor 39